MDVETRILSTPKEMDACIALQKTLWVLEDQGGTSPISLKAWTYDPMESRNAYLYLTLQRGRAIS